MAFGIGEDPNRSVTTFLDVDYPINRDDLIHAAEEGGATVDVINIYKSLPGAYYRSKDAVLRDLAEASRRFGISNRRELEDDGAIRERRDIGKEAVENAPEPHTRHP